MITPSSHFDDKPLLFEFIAKNAFEKIDGVLLDLGFSSFQIDEASRGFSFLNEGPLDMRMNSEEETWTAADYVNQASEEELKKIFQNYGEERFSGRIARNIVEFRNEQDFESTKQLAQVIERSVPGKFRHGRTHPATKVFQALRIAVNRELECLDQFLNHGFSYLNSGARVLIISFHSLEDRKVKWAFRNRQDFKIITKKPIEASEEEVEVNPRSRSAKLRVFEKI